MIPHRNGLECDVCGKKATALYGVMCCLSCQEKVGRGVYRQSKRYVYTHRQNPKRERWWQFWRPAWTVEKEEMRA
jgi:hypothetical protein